MSGGRGLFGRRRAPAGGAGLHTAVAELMAAIDSGGDLLPDDDVIAAERVLKKASQRLGLADGHTVVALAGATGSGKSSLFNALVGADVSRSGQLRPTTSRVTAATWGAPASELLDWLRVTDRYDVPLTPQVGGRLDGLVLLDLPDIDSTRVEHRVEADRVLDLADVVVWVTDPQKYADALMHEKYLARSAHHAGVTYVVLNQADRMRPDEALACRADLERLLAAEGLGGTEVFLTSARTHVGLDELGQVLERAVATKTAARERLLGDVRHAAATLRADVADEESPVGEADDALVDALARSAGLPVVLAAIEADHRRRALAATGWPFTRWVRGLRPDPLARLRLDAKRDRTGEVTPLPDDVERIVRRSSVPEPTPAARADVDLVTRRLGARAARGLPPAWASAVHEAARPADARLADALDRAIVGTPIDSRRPAWWWFAGALQWICALALVAGVVWLGALGVLAWMQLPAPEPPRVGVVPWPTILAVGGLALGLLLAVLARRLAAVGARRRRRRVETELREAIRGVARDDLIAPVAGVVARHRATREHLDAALSA